MNADFSKKLRSLWADRRPYTKRLLYAGAASAAFCFTFLFFGPLEMVAFGEASLSYGYEAVAGLLALGAAAVLAVFAPLMALLKGRIFNYIVTAVFAFTVAGYLQSAFFNGSLGALNGEAVDWPILTDRMVGNLLLWLGIWLGVSLLMYFHRGLWKKAVTLISGLLIVMQLAPTVAILLGNYRAPDLAEVKSYALSAEGMESLSHEGNLLVLVLDQLDYDYIEAVLKEDPAFFDRLDGFTSYTNAISTFARTQPALNHLLTGAEELAYQVSELDYFNGSWEQTALLPQLKEQGYKMDFYTHLPYLFRDIDYAEEYAANLMARGDAVKPLTMVKKLWNLSAYRYMPLMMKPFYWADTKYYNQDIYKDGADIYYFDDAAYGPILAESIIGQQEKAFKFYHFNGPHFPYTLKADGTESETPTSVKEQTMGIFNILFSLFDRMKELGIYEESAILITADHGSAVDDYQPLQKATRMGLFYKPAGSAETPLTYSSAPVSSENIPATLAKAAGLEHQAYGRALDEIGEEEALVRTYYKVVSDPQTNKESTVYQYEVLGNAAVFSNWKQVAVTDVVAYFY